MKHMNIESVNTTNDGENSHAAKDTNYSSYAPANVSSMAGTREELMNNAKSSVQISKNQIN